MAGEGITGNESSRLRLPEAIHALRGRSRRIMGEDQHVKAAVLLPLVQNENGEWAVLFEKRAKTMRRQAGEMCFPGGHCDASDLDEQETAIRETSEELGIPQSHIDCIASLDVLVTWSRLLVYPFVGRISRVKEIRPNPAEVDEIFTVELQRLLTATPQVHAVQLKPNPPEDFPYHLLPNGRDYVWRDAQVNQVFYEFDGRIIWGMTARILTHFLTLLHSS